MAKDHKADTPDALSPRDLVTATCHEVAADRSAPAAARIAAARLLAEMLGLAGKLQAGAIDAGEGAHSEMSAAELDREIARLAKKA
jgi:hypothetical protein